MHPSLSYRIVSLFRFILYNLEQSLPHSNLTSLLHTEFNTPLRSLKHQNNRTPQTKSAHFLACAKGMASQESRGVGVGGFCVGTIGFFAEEVVCTEIFIKVYADGANVGGSDWGHAEETESPATEDGHPFVKGE